MTARVVRTAEFVNPSDVPPVKEVALVLRGSESGRVFYNVSKDGTALAVPLELVSSNDPDCPKTRSRTAKLSVLEGRRDVPDKVTLRVDRCPEHSAVFLDGGIGKDSKRRKPLVQVVISERTGRPA